MKPRIACDTNVLVSALIAQGPPSRVVELAIEGRIELLVPAPALEELERVLRAKLGFNHEDATAAVSLVSSLAAELVPTPETVEQLTDDPDDDLILACALEARADVLVSGDRRHLLPLGQVGDTRVLTPQALLSELS